MSAYRDNPREPRGADEDFARLVVAPKLLPGEVVLWANRPVRGLVFARNPNAFVQIVWTLFSLLWSCCGFLTDVSFAVSLLGIPFFLSGLYGLMGHALHDAFHRRRLAYGITNRRLLVLTPSRVLAAPWLGELRTHLLRRPDGSGNIRVVSPRIELRLVPDAEAVHRLLLEAQAAAPESGSPALDDPSGSDQLRGPRSGGDSGLPPDPS